MSNVIKASGPNIIEFIRLIVLFWFIKQATLDLHAQSLKLLDDFAVWGGTTFSKFRKTENSIIDLWIHIHTICKFSLAFCRIIDISAEPPYIANLTVKWDGFNEMVFLT